MRTGWLSLEKIHSLVSVEPLLIFFALLILAKIALHTILRNQSNERKRDLATLIRGTTHTLFLTIALFGAYIFSDEHSADSAYFASISAFLGLTCLIFGSYVFVKIIKIIALEYLFLGHLRAGVPILLVNILTLAVSILLAGWISTEAFNIKLGPLLATSAIVSIVLGLALQDTLGNLFAGIALQFDKPFEIGDWVEVIDDQQDMQTGKVIEISWRATKLLGLFDQVILIPNRSVAQLEVINYSEEHRPFLRGHTVRLDVDVDLDRILPLLGNSPLASPYVCLEPKPFAYLREIKESWLEIRVVYYTKDYGMQFLIGDAVQRNILRVLQTHRVPLAKTKLEVIHESLKRQNSNA